VVVIHYEEVLYQVYAPLPLPRDILPVYNTQPATLMPLKRCVTL